MENSQNTLPMHTLLLCSDVQFLGVTHGVLNKLQVTPRIVGNCDDALQLLSQHSFDVLVVDWREISNLGEFLTEVRRSKLNPECVLVAIVRDLLDLRQAFAAGVHFLIHKPPSTVQIERCLRAAYRATVARRRKQHREPVHILAWASTRTQPCVELVVANLSEGGAGVVLQSVSVGFGGARLSVGEEIGLRFPLPGSGVVVQSSGRVVWTSGVYAGIRFSFIPEGERNQLQSWLTECVERSLAELCERLRLACA